MRAQALLLALCLIAHAAHGEGWRVSPTTISMPAERPLSSFTVANAGDEEKSFEISAFLWTQVNGESVLTPTRDLVVAPSVFLTAPGAEQTVRLGLATPADPARELSYRIVLRELPSAMAPAPENGLRLIVEASMPVFVAPRGLRSALSVRSVSRSEVVLSNTGAAHIALAPLPTGRAIDAMPRYLLAGAQAQRSLGTGAGPVSVLTAGPGLDGAQLQTFELGDAPLIAGLR